MTSRAAPSWQVVLCDLALILFLTTLAAAQEGGPEAPDAMQQSERAQELAVYRDGAGGLTLEQWLAEQPGDARTQVTVLARYAPADFAAVEQRARVLAGSAAKADKPPRLIIEPAKESAVIVSLAYDAPQAASQAHSTRLRPASLAR